MPTEWEQGLHDLVASIRAVCTSLADPRANFLLNADLGASAYLASPRAAIGIVASMTTLRLERRKEILQSAGQETGFPRDELLQLLPPQRPSSRPSADVECLDFLEAFVSGPMADVELVQGLIDRHGLISFMRLAHLNNLAGSMLVEVDQSFDSLQELMSAEALEDETEYFAWGDE